MTLYFRRIILYLYLSGGLASAVFAQENYEIRKIVIKGNETLEKDFILDKLAVKEVSFLKKTFTDKEPFLYNRELLNLDLDRLKAVYQQEGFLDVEAGFELKNIDHDKRTVELLFSIEEGQPVRVDTLTIEISGETPTLNADSLSKLILEDLALKKDERFRDQQLKKDMQTISDFFMNRGYAYVEVDYAIDLKLDEYQTNIYYTVNTGPVCELGATTISGNEHYTEEFILKQLTFNEGDIYDKSALSESRKFLYNLQIFRIVSILPQKNPETRLNPIPVKIYIEEAPRFSTRFGVGYGTEDKFRAFADLNQRGLLGGARRINLYVKHSALLPYSVSLRWIQPHFLSKRTTITINPFINRQAEPGYETRTYGLNLPLSYQHNDFWNSSVTYYYENVEQKVEQGDQEFTHIEDDKFPYTKSGFLINSVFDNSEPRFSPEEGININLGFKINGYLLGGTFSYSRLWGDFRTYRNLGPVIFAFRLMAGGIHSSDTSKFIPVEDRFYAGGSNSVRGWNRANLGPKRESGTPLGGKSIIETNLELRYFLFWRLSIVGFLDVGNVWEESYTYSFNDLAYAVGSGLRVETPIGPVRLDVGVPIWNDKKSPQFFLSVGQAF